MITAAVLTGLGQPLELVEGIAVPELRPGQVLVKIAYSGVCMSQVMEQSGGRGHDAWLPHMLGHEATGRVIATGSEVGKVAEGDAVVLGWIRGTGAECGGCQYPHGDRTINAGGVTTFSTHAVVSENRLVKLPEGVPMDVGVLFGCALPTGAGIVLNELDPRPGTSIAVFGLGGIGMSALMACRIHDFAKVVPVDVSAEKLALARELGCEEWVNAAGKDPQDVIRDVHEITRGGADYCVEASGRVGVIEQAFLSSHPKHGLTVFASHPPAGEKISLDPHHLIAGRQIRGSWGGGCDPDRDIPRFAELYRDGTLPLERLITARYGLEQVNEALDDLRAGRAWRPLIEIDPNA